MREPRRLKRFFVLSESWAFSEVGSEVCKDWDRLWSRSFRCFLGICFSWNITGYFGQVFSQLEIFAYIFIISLEIDVAASRTMDIIHKHYSNTSNCFDFI